MADLKVEEVTLADMRAKAASEKRALDDVRKSRAASFHWSHDPVPRNRGQTDVRKTGKNEDSSHFSFAGPTPMPVDVRAGGASRLRLRQAVLHAKARVCTQSAFPVSGPFCVPLPTLRLSIHVSCTSSINTPSLC